MAFAVLIQFRIGISESQPLTQHLHLPGWPGKERPSWARAVSLGIVFQHFRSVMRGIKGKGVEEDIMAHARAEQALDLGQILSHARTDAITGSVHEVDEHQLIL